MISYFYYVYQNEETAFPALTQEVTGKNNFLIIGAFSTTESDSLDT